MRQLFSFYWVNCFSWFGFIVNEGIFLVNNGDDEHDAVPER